VPPELIEAMLKGGPYALLVPCVWLIIYFVRENSRLHKEYGGQLAALHTKYADELKGLQAQRVEEMKTVTTAAIKLAETTETLEKASWSRGGSK
jgi:hypothetical protein